MCRKSFFLCAVGKKKLIYCFFSVIISNFVEHLNGHILCAIKTRRMIDRYLKRDVFTSYEDFLENYEVNVPEDFNFGYDVIDAYAEEEPERVALLWTNDKGDEKRVTYREFKDVTDRCASFFLSIGIEKGDRVMLILKRRIEWWYTMVALHKIGAVVIPATHMPHGWHQLHYSMW